MSDCIYDFNLEADRERFIQREPCKVMRKIYVEMIEKRWDSCGDWKKGNNCGCTYQCKRKKNIQEAQKKSESI